MINEAIERLLLYDDHPLMIEASECATVRSENKLLHALMLLSTVGYSVIPVLDREQRLVGSISTPLILSGIKTSTEYNWDQLEEMTVGEVMDTRVGVLQQPYDLEDVLHKLVDYNYVCIVDDHGLFLGIITRKEILTRVNFLAHQIDHYYDLSEKDAILSLIS